MRQHGDHGSHDHGSHDHAAQEHASEQRASEQRAEAGESHEGHGHAPGGGWWARNLELAMSLLSGVLLVLGFVGERMLGLPFGVALVFYLGVYAAGGYNLARHAIPSVLHGRFDVEFLMLAGALGAAFLGDWAEGAFLLFLFSLGHALEHSAMERARDAINALGKLTPKTARVRRDNQEIEVPVEALRIGNVAIVRPGDRVAVDGISTHGALVA